MSSINYKDTIQKVVEEYDFKTGINIRIFLGKEKQSYLIRSKKYIRGNEVSIKFDPDKILSYRDYQNSYYCTTSFELIELITYIHRNEKDFILFNDDSEDVLEQKDTQFKTVFELEK